MTSMQYPTLRARGPLRDALTARTLASLTAEQLATFLMGRRWFGAKGSRLQHVRISDVIPLPWDGVRAAIARVEVQLGDVTWCYQLPLAVRESGTAAPDGAVPAPERLAILAEIDADGQRGFLFDATQDPAFREALGAAFAQGAAFEGEGVRWVVERVGDDEPGTEPGMPSRVGSAEQSNTSIIYADRAILKLFRKLDEGENPDVEISRFLTTRTGFRNTPALLGTIRFERDSGGTSVAGMLQRLVPDSTDAWAWALAHARSFIARPAATNEFADSARELGSVTRRLHDALASDAADGDFAPVPVAPADLARWALSVRRSVSEGFELLRARLEAGALGAGVVADARMLAGGPAEHEFLDRIGAISESLAGRAGARMRHHGDYHLGQVLRSADGTFFIIDFEGEPARPLAERREKHSPLRDVAGMMRSFAYAAATGAMDASGEAEHASAYDRALRWEADARKSFLNGYMDVDGRYDAVRPPFLPTSSAGVGQLIALFEIEKVFYELRYELNNRPDWAWIPLRGIARFLDTGMASPVPPVQS